MPDFHELADRVWVARHDWFDVNVTAIGSARGVVVVDTHGSAAAGRRVLDDVRRLGAGEVVGVVTTHWHFDHTFGTAAFREEYADVPVHAHEAAREELAARAPDVRARYLADAEADHRAEVLATEVVPPDHTFSSTRVLDLGDRTLELVHPGRGHTAGDLVVLVPDADVLVAGDLVEESGPPAFGDDCWPMDWPASLDIVLGLAPPTAVVVPGHGSPVDREFVDRQRHEIGFVAETIRDLAGRGIPVDEAVAAGDWPYPTETMGDAVRRGYAQLPRSQKRLPML